MENLNNNPWIALGSYEEKDANRFFGRENDTTHLLNMLLQNDYAVCYAASGDGKSSLINAGLCPSLRKSGFFPIKISCTSAEYEGKGLPTDGNGNYDFDAFLLKKIENCLKEREKFYEQKGWTNEDCKVFFEKKDIYKDIQIDNSLWWKLRTETIQIPYGEYDYIPVLIFDQFEEFFSAQWVKDFFVWLEKLSNDNCPEEILKKSIENGLSIEDLPCKKMFKLLISMRYEYAGELDYYIQQKAYIPSLSRNRYFLKPFTKEQAVEIINSQAQSRPDDETSLKLSEHANEITEHIISKKGRDEVSSILLSIVCHELYDTWSKRSNSAINFDVKEVIYNYYNNTIRSTGLSRKDKRNIEKALISSSKKRLRIPCDKIIGINNDYITRLTESHILRKSTFGDVDYIELVHDKLAEIIGEKNDEKKSIRPNGRIILISFLALTLLSVITYFVFGKDKVVSNEGFNFTVKLNEEKEIAGKLTWRANLTIIASGYLGDSTLIETTINDEFIDSVLTFNVDSIKNVHLILNFVKNEKEELRNIDKTFSISELKSNPNISILISRDTSKYIPITGKVFTSLNNKDYAIQDALVILRGTPQETDKNGTFRFKLIDSLKAEETVYIIKEGYKSIETSLKNYNSNNQLIYKLESIDSFSSFLSECITIDSMLNNTPNPRKKWRYGYSTFFENSPYPAHLHSGDEDEIVIIAKDTNTTKNKDKIDRKEIYGIYYFVKEASRQKNKHYAYHIFTGYIDNEPFTENKTIKKFDIESRDIFGNKQIISDGKYYKEGGFYRMSGVIKNHADTIAIFMHK